MRDAKRTTALNKKNSDILSDWTNEINETTLTFKTLCLAVFTVDKKLVYTTDAMNSFFKGNPSDSLMNPRFDILLSLDNNSPLIFEGYLTLGDYISTQNSIWARVYRKKDHLLIIGSLNTHERNKQTATLQRLNSTLSNIQRELINENHTLENTTTELNKSNYRLKKLNTDKDLFISTLAHDLRGPFSVILGFLNILLENIETEDPTSVKQQLNYVNNSALSTFKLLENTLLWVTADAGKLSCKPDVQKLKYILPDVINGLKPSAETKNINLELNIIDDTPVFIDLNIITVVIQNLISNAIKFSNDNGTVTITSELDLNKEKVIVSVIDHGVGIDKEKAELLLNGERQASTKGTVGEAGSGLGLSLCKRFIDKHGEKIWVESKLGRGSKFRFTVPISRK